MPASASVRRRHAPPHRTLGAADEARTWRSSGRDASFLPFLKDRDVALLGADTAHEAGSIPGVTLPSGGSYPSIHRFAIVARGMNLLDNLDLEAVAETAARLKRWEFMLIVAPPRVPGGTGSPINPIAMF